MSGSSSSSKIECVSLTATKHAGYCQVKATLRFPTLGYSFSLKLKEPQGFNPKVLLLEAVITEPSGMVGQQVEEKTETFLQPLANSPEYTDVSLVEPAATAKIN